MKYNIVAFICIFWPLFVSLTPVFLLKFQAQASDDYSPVCSTWLHFMASALLFVKVKPPVGCAKPWQKPLQPFHLTKLNPPPMQSRFAYFLSDIIDSWAIKICIFFEQYYRQLGNKKIIKKISKKYK